MMMMIEIFESVLSAAGRFGIFLFEEEKETSAKIVAMKREKSGTS